MKNLNNLVSVIKWENLVKVVEFVNRGYFYRF